MKAFDKLIKKKENLRDQVRKVICYKYIYIINANIINKYTGSDQVIKWWVECQSHDDLLTTKLILDYIII